MMCIILTCCTDSSHSIISATLRRVSGTLPDMTALRVGNACPVEDVTAAEEHLGGGGTTGQHTAALRVLFCAASFSVILSVPAMANTPQRLRPSRWKPPKAPK